MPACHVVEGRARGFERGRGRVSLCHSLVLASDFCEYLIHFHIIPSRGRFVMNPFLICESRSAGKIFVFDKPF